MEITTILILFFAGLSAGIINTLAGSGSVVTLSILIFFGVPANVANGTNRIGVLAQSIVGSVTFWRKEKLKMEGNYILILPAVLGATLGTLIAVDLDKDTMQKVIGGLMVFILIVLLVNPKKYIKEQTGGNKWLKMVIFFFVGLYGGFIQAGVGVFMLTALVMVAGKSFVESNAIKVLIVVFFTIPALGIFIYYDQVNWTYGLLLAVGQSFGGWLGAIFSAEHPKANAWTKKILIVIVVVSILRMFNIISVG